MLAEIAVHRGNPEFQLTRGPGKTLRGRPGWAESVAVVGDEDASPISRQGLVSEDKPSNSDLPCCRRCGVY